MVRDSREAPLTISSQPLAGNALGERALFKAWAVFFLLATVIGFLAGVAGGFVLGMFFAATGGDLADVQRWSILSGYVAGVPVSYLCFRFCAKRFIVEPVITRCRSIGERPL